MILIAPQEIVLAVVEGNLLSIGAVFVLYVICSMAWEAAAFFRRWPSSKWPSL